MKVKKYIARTALAFACKHAIVLLALLVCFSTITARAGGCPSSKDEINTDRPDVTNSSLVVPAGSLQIEDGVNFSGMSIDHNTFIPSEITSCRVPL